MAINRWWAASLLLAVSATFVVVLMWGNIGGSADDAVLLSETEEMGSLSHNLSASASTAPALRSASMAAVTCPSQAAPIAVVAAIEEVSDRPETDKPATATTP